MVQAAIKFCTRWVLMISCIVWMLPNAWSQQAQPNILVVVADDLGFTDLGSFGGEIQTPNLDALATQGVRFSNFYTAPTCSPTRAMLLTGADHHLVGLGSMAEALAPNQRGKPGYEGYLNERAAILPEAFSQAGYRTLMAGKWHLGKKKEHSPAARGFHRSFALLEGGAGHLDDMGIMAEKASYREDGEPAQVPTDFYSTQFYTDKLIEYIDEGRQTGKPFFGYLAYTAPHWPLQAPQSSIDKYRGKYHRGYDALYEHRDEGAKAAGVVAESASTVPRLDGQPAWSELDAAQQQVAERAMEIYAAMVDDMDQHFGRLVDYLKRTGQLDNTIIFFMSDNGAEGSSLDREFKGFAKFIAQCCNNDYDNMGKPKSFVLYGPNWARAAMIGSRDYKGRTTEGGIKSPAFMFNPKMNQTATVSNQFFTVKDVLPTLMDLANVPLPTDSAVAVEGQSIYQRDASVEPEMGWELFGGRAYRKGDWKIVSTSPHMGGTGDWRLYHLAVDPGEQNDLKAQEPERYRQLLDLWQRYERDKGVILPNSHW